MKLILEYDTGLTRAGRDSDGRQWLSFVVDAIGTEQPCSICGDCTHHGWFALNDDDTTEKVTIVCWKHVRVSK